MSKFISQLRGFLIGESRPIRPLPLQEKRDFYVSLGVNTLGVLAMLLIFAILANTTFVHGGWTRMIVWQICLCLGLIVGKRYLSPFKVSLKENKRSVNPTYEIMEDYLIISHRGKSYKCEDYTLSREGELEDCFLVIEDVVSETESREVLLYYLGDCNAFIEQTTYRRIVDVATEYKILSWFFYVVNILLSIYWVVKFIAIILNWVGCLLANFFLFFEKISDFF